MNWEQQLLTWRHGHYCPNCGAPLSQAQALKGECPDCEEEWEVPKEAYEAAPQHLKEEEK